jgi:hypothetical protein
VGHCFIVSSKIAGYLRLLFELAGARWCWKIGKLRSCKFSRIQSSSTLQS